MSQDEFALPVNVKTESPRKITTPKTPNHRNKNPEAEPRGPEGCVPVLRSEQGIVPVIPVCQHFPVRTRRRKRRHWEAAGADRAVNNRQSSPGLGRACRGDKPALRAVIEELRTAPRAASVRALLLIIFGPNFLIPGERKLSL